MSNPEVRAEHYGNCGRVLAGTASNLGYPVPEGSAESWAETMSRLSSADDMSEARPEGLDAEFLLEFLDLDSSNPKLLNSAINLLTANRISLESQDLGQHFAGRVQEALSTLDLLRYQAGSERISGEEELWGELGKITVVSSHMDSLTDWQEDAILMPQFTAGQLAWGGLVNMARDAVKVKPRTVTAFFKALAEYPATRSVILDRIIHTPMKKSLAGA